MATTAYHRGHKILYMGNVWTYADTLAPVAQNPNRPCGHCGKENTPEGHDGCLGILPGAMNACCGHGDDTAAYVQFPRGTILHGSEAITMIEKLKILQQ